MEIQSKNNLTGQPLPVERESEQLSFFQHLRVIETFP